MFCVIACLRVAPPAKVLYGGQALQQRQARKMSKVCGLAFRSNLIKAIQKRMMGLLRCVRNGAINIGFMSVLIF